jgi:CreA protein
MLALWVRDDHLTLVLNSTPDRPMFKRLAALAAPIAVVALLAGCSDRNEVGSVGVDWTGNDIAVEAVADPDIQGIVCHVAYFNRSFIDRMSQGNWFEDPSYSAVDCEANGPLTIGDISLAKGGEEIFQQSRSLIWKSLRVSRVYDQANNSLVYLAHARELQQGSGKMSLSVVPLTDKEVTWTKGAPAVK